MAVRVLWAIAYNRARIAYYAWALREIRPDSCWVPRIVLHLSALRQHQKRLAHSLKTGA